MMLPSSQERPPELHTRPHRKKQLAKRLESLVSVATAVVAISLLVGVGFAIFGGGPQVPAWMH
jgi:hypothetical protein